MLSAFSGNKRLVSICLAIAIAYNLFAQNFPEKPVVPDLFQPLQLNYDTTIIYLTDFFPYPEKIDSISMPEQMRWRWTRNNNNTLTVIATPLSNDTLQPLSEMKLWSGGYAYNVLLRKSKKKLYQFIFDPKGKTYTSVQLAGEMNDWNPKKTAFEFKDGIWKVSILLNPGVYQYQVVVDDKWMLDPVNPNKADNNSGGFNSVFKAGVRKRTEPLLHADSTADGKIVIHVTPFTWEEFAYWQDFELEPFLETGKTDEHITLTIPGKARSMQRSYIRVYADDDWGESNNILIPLEYGEVVTDPKKLTLADKEADIIYFILVDRFCNGDTTNDQKVTNPKVKPKANYYGGDLAGIIKQMDYLRSLNVNTLWLSPIIQNPETAFQEFPEPHDWYSGYHGYWPISLTQIDHRFGDDKVFKQLIFNAHFYTPTSTSSTSSSTSGRMNILIDLVANHVHEDYPLIKQHPEWRTQLDLPGGQKNIRLWDECRLTTWFDTFLPTLDFNNPDVLKMEVDSSFYWVNKFHIDGFRHDATKHIPTSFWRALTLRLKKEHKSIYQLGETYGSKELISSYIGTGLLDGQFDFNLYFDARAAFAKDDVGFEKLAETLQESLDTYGSHNLMGNISGNHDIPRFISLAGGALSFSEDSRKAGWERDVEVGPDTNAYRKLAMLHAFNATIPGVPVIYYGDEIGMPGAGDPDNRRMMKFDSLTRQETELKYAVSQLLDARKNHLSLVYGDFKIIQADKKALIYQRQYFDETAMVFFNNENKEKYFPFIRPEGKIINMPEFNIFPAMIGAPSATDNNYYIILPPRSFGIIFLENK